MNRSKLSLFNLTMSSCLLSKIYWFCLPLLLVLGGSLCTIRAENSSLVQLHKHERKLNKLGRHFDGLGFTSDMRQVRGQPTLLVSHEDYVLTFGIQELAGFWNIRAIAEELVVPDVVFREGVFDFPGWNCSRVSEGNLVWETGFKSSGSLKNQCSEIEATMDLVNAFVSLAWLSNLENIMVGMAEEWGVDWPPFAPEVFWNSGRTFAGIPTPTVGDGVYDSMATEITYSSTGDPLVFLEVEGVLVPCVVDDEVSELVLPTSVQYRLEQSGKLSGKSIEGAYMHSGTYGGTESGTWQDRYALDVILGDWSMEAFYVTFEPGEFGRLGRGVLNLNPSVWTWELDNDLELLWFWENED